MKLFRFIASIVVAVALFNGCALTPKQAAYKTLKTAGDTVDAAMKVYAAACNAGKVSPELQAKIDDLHDNKFNPAFRAAILAAKFDYSAPASADLISLVTELTTSIAKAAQ
jgi:hypothetical protein